jgi:hypothetical protein
MALFSFRHSVKTFSTKARHEKRVAKPGQTLAHLRYISRPSAAREVLMARISEDNISKAAEYAEELALKSSGRVCERFTIALPVEATEAQREHLVSAYAEHLTLGISGYIAAIHDKKGNARQNPHFHLVCFDTKVATGGRGRPRSVLGMARNNAVENAAHDWASIHNRLMDEWGYGPESMIDHRSFLERGIDRIPTIHEGPGARAVSKRRPPKAKAEWRKVDGGHTRADANNIIREINSMKEKRDGRRFDRLGSDNQGDATRGKSRVPWDRKNSGSSCGNPGTAGKRERERPKGFGAGKRTPRTNRWDRSHAGQTARSNTKGVVPPHRQTKGNPLAEVKRHPRPDTLRKRPVRRIYRELVLTRDTLKTRLLHNGAQSQVLNTANNLTTSNARPNPEKRTRREDFDRE